MADYAIIGFGCAGYYGAKAIRENDPDGTITVYSEHGYSPYNPMLTTYYVAGKISCCQWIFRQRIRIFPGSVKDFLFSLVSRHRLW